MSCGDLFFNWGFLLLGYLVIIKLLLSHVYVCEDAIGPFALLSTVVNLQGARPRFNSPVYSVL
jgi:hypothetical protein